MPAGAGRLPSHILECSPPLGIDCASSLCVMSARAHDHPVPEGPIQVKPLFDGLDFDHHRAIIGT